MQVKVHRIAEKYFNRLNASDRKTIKSALEGLQEEPPKCNIERYEGHLGVFRLKIKGCKYRILFKYESDCILATHIEPRGQAYTKKTKSRRGSK